MRTLDSTKLSEEEILRAFNAVRYQETQKTLPMCRFPAGTDQEQISKRETREAIEAYCSTLPPEVAEAASEFQGDEPPGRHVPKNVRSSRIGWGVLWLAFLAACAYLGLS